jgi:hypothetical protein
MVGVGGRWTNGARRRRRRREIAPPPGGMRCRDDELAREICKSNRGKRGRGQGPDPRGPWSVSRKAVYRNEYFSIPRSAP